LLRLIWALIDAGVDTVTAPRCAGCGRAARDMPMVREDGGLCVPCYRLATRTSCARCGRATKNAYRRPEGIICASCRDAEPDSRDSCPGCGYERPLRRRPDGTFRCDACVPKPLHTCSGCGNIGQAAAITDSGPLCNWCRQKSTARRCGSCGRTRPVAREATATTPDLCTACRPRTVDVCAGCQRRTFGNRTGLPWAVAGKIAPILADLALVVLLARLGGAEHGRLVAWLYAVCPLAVLVSALHGQVEPVALALGAGALLAARRGALGWAPCRLGGPPMRHPEAGHAHPRHHGERSTAERSDGAREGCSSPINQFTGRRNLFGGDESGT
jgi:hypothetical protein